MVSSLLIKSKAILVEVLFFLNFTSIKNQSLTIAIVLILLIKHQSWPKKDRQTYSASEIVSPPGIQIFLLIYKKCLLVYNTVTHHKTLLTKTSTSFFKSIHSHVGGHKLAWLVWVTIYFKKISARFFLRLMFFNPALVPSITAEHSMAWPNPSLFFFLLVSTLIS